MSQWKGIEILCTYLLYYYYSHINYFIFIMKNIIKNPTFILLTLLLSGSLYYSCKKDPLPIPSSGEYNAQADERGGGSGGQVDTYALTCTDIGTSNGMYVFGTYSSMEHVVYSLESMMGDENLNHQSLSELGFSSEEDNGAPIQPVLEKFNRRFTVSTSRQKTEQIINGIAAETLPESELEKVVVGDPVLGSVLNQDNEVQIGSLVYKYLDAYRTLVFHPSLLATVHASSSPWDLPEQFNLFKLDNRKQEDTDLYKGIESANAGGECMFDIVWSNDLNQFYFHSIGFFPSNGQVVWKILDANGTVLATQNGLSVFNFLVPNNAVYPLYVSIESQGCHAWVEKFANSAPTANYDCNKFDFTFNFTSNPNNREVKFNIPPMTPSITWDFDNDGITDFTSGPAGPAGGSFIHTFPDDNGENVFVVCATVHGEFCTKTVCKTVGAVGCGIRSHTFAKTDKYFTPFRAVMEWGLFDPWFGKSRIWANIVHFRSIFKNKADKLDIFLNASGNNMLGDLRFFNPQPNDGCQQVDQIAVATGTFISKLTASRILEKNSTMRKADMRCRFVLTKTLPNPPGGVNPFTKTWELGF